MIKKKKRNNATITFADKSQKEQLQAILRSETIQNLMPSTIRRTDYQMLLWAVEHLHQLAFEGKILADGQAIAEEFQKAQLLKYKINDLKIENEQMKTQIKQLEVNLDKYKDIVNSQAKQSKNFDMIEKGYIDSLNSAIRTLEKQKMELLQNNKNLEIANAKVKKMETEIKWMYDKHKEAPTFEAITFLIEFCYNECRYIFKSSIEES